MKQRLIIIIAAVILYSCGSSDANKTDGNASISQSEKKETKSPSIATSKDGWYMSANINGKDCIAQSIALPEGYDQIVGFYDGDRYIGLPYHQSDLVVGKKISFSDQNATLTTSDSVAIRNGDKGVLEITKVDGNWAEGKFFFTAVSYDAQKSKTIEVTNGFFRIAATLKK